MLLRRGWFRKVHAAPLTTRANGVIIFEMRTSVSALWILCLAILPLPAQWLNQPTTGIPRTPDGRPNLSAPAPKAADAKPDLSGLWRLGVEIGVGANITADLPPADIQPWVAALARHRLEDFGKDDPEITGCMPGGPRHITRGGLTKIIQTPGLLVMLYEDLAYRQIFLDGRELPTDPNPNWMDIRSAAGKATRWWSKPPDSTTAPGWISRVTATPRPCA